MFSIGPQAIHIMTASFHNWHSFQIQACHCWFFRCHRYLSCSLTSI